MGNNAFYKKKIFWILLFLLALISWVLISTKWISIRPIPFFQKTQIQKETYFCPMHPSIVSDKPGHCPICHMELQKKTEDVQKKEKSDSKHEGGQEEKTSEVSGRATFSLSPERQQLIGVTTTKVKSIELQSEIRANGKVAFDPELFISIEEYIQAIQAREKLSQSSFKEVREQALEMVSISETKLKLMGLSQEQIQLLALRKQSPMNLLLPEGLVWIYAEIFEYEMAGVKIGQSLSVHTPALPGKTFNGVISSISPILDVPTRTFRIRGEVPDPEKILKPDSFVNVKIKIDLGQKLAIPSDAVLHAGDKNFVFVVKEKGIFEPRSVTLGMKTNEYYEVMEGLTEGEEVVTAANFLIDSESRLRSVLKELEDKKDSKPVQEHRH